MNTLVVVWKSDNDIDIEKFILPYAYNASLQGWFDEVIVLVWGASQKKLSETSDYVDQVQKLIKQGISFHACKMCADTLGVTSTLEAIGVRVHYTGEFLSKHLLDPNSKVITL